MAEIVALADHRPPQNPGNGAREAMMEVVAQRPAHCLGEWDAPACADWVLAMLWQRGFKVVPLK